MKICSKCRAELRCIKTGVTVRYGEDHCYRGDKYKCLDCGAEVVFCNDQSFRSDRDWPEDEFIQMD